ncbi:MAG: HAMP domain-containing protein, partial [Leptospiraceae bacterium]|nr:HAMP domain-containing protein [Leptospiraceae bacterium]
MPAYIVQRVSSIHRLILSKAYAIRNLPEKDFRAELETLLNDTSVDSDFYPFAQTLQAHLSRTDADGAALRSEILEYVQPMLLPGERLYRADTQRPAEQKHYVVFLQSDVDGQKIYEAGFEYTAYRDYIHESAVRLVYMLIGILVVALIGLRLFFSGSLLTPLRRLLDGVTEVNSGNLNVHVPIQIEDDFGYLSRSFNGMVRSIRESKDKLQDYADLLEARVKERTAELQNTLEEVQQLKNQQDGDYFLTALLMGPLSANKVESETVSVSFLIEQKKKFQFRRWQNEIGGDTCMAHNIRLRNRRYVVFVNADAMGKSVQGAGGVLVMGSVLEAIIERTRLSSETQKQYPERWLKNAFIEMHKVLETFDGLMLISLVIGLLEEETGMLYYL